MPIHSLKISVIIPVYNGEEYIYTCLKNICNQTYQNIEIIVINDGSTDKTEEIIKKNNDIRIKSILIPNSGVSKARNIGIKKATGDYIMFLDVDDYLKENAIEKLVDISTKNPNIDIIRFNGYIQDENKKYTPIEMPIDDYLIINTQNEKEKIIDIFNSPYNSLRCYSPLLMMKNEDIMLFNTNLTYLEDKLFYLENMLKKSKNILFLKEKFYYYNYNVKSKTKNIDFIVKNIKDIIKANNEISKFIKSVINDESIIHNSSLSLIIYRLEYYSVQMKYADLKNILEEIRNTKEIKTLLKKCTKNIKKTQRIQSILLEKKLYFLFYLSCKIKKILKKMR